MSGRVGIGDERKLGARLRAIRAEFARDGLEVVLRKPRRADGCHSG